MKELFNKFKNKLVENKKIALIAVAIIVVIIVAIIVISNINNNKEVTKLDYNKETDTYEIGGGKIVIEDDFEIGYDVVTKKYTVYGTITNKTDKEYKELELKFEFYNQKKEVIGDATKTIKNLKANDKTDMKFSLDKQPSQMIYDYKIVDVKAK